MWGGTDCQLLAARLFEFEIAWPAAMMEGERLLNFGISVVVLLSGEERTAWQVHVKFKLLREDSSWIIAMLYTRYVG